MKQTRNLIIILLGFSTVATCFKWDEEEMVRRGNNYIDKIIRDMVVEKGDSYDPYVLEDKKISFTKKLVVTNLTGEAKLYNGSLKGLKTLHRTDFSSLREMEDYFIVVTELGANDLELRYFGSVKVNGRGPTITIRAVADFIKVTMNMQINSTTGRNGQLNELKIHEIHQIHVWIHGLGPVTWAMTSLSGAVTGIFQNYVRREVEKKLKAHIASRIGSYQFPMEDSTYFLSE